ncbi:MAG: class I SAM-dependent methyltransferase, partial [Pyrinomonadaceae bacterium]|nr:class I SAM-dependent methyltransferase [Pyrinomonadaceae bacterium]
RFSNRVANYVKYRPGYPPEVVELFRDEMNLTPASVMADVGSGTGLSAKIFLENGNMVYGVEPNAAMRAAAEEFLAAFPNFVSIDGTSEATMLGEASIDIVIAAQAFHWFRPEETHREFKRILKTGGYVALIWNERQLDSTEFLREYEKLLLKYARDYEQVRHEKINEDVLSAFFQVPFRRATFPNVQDFDFEGLKGRMLSSSYMPSETDDDFQPMVKELEILFAKHNESGRIKVFYDTNIFYCQL